MSGTVPTDELLPCPFCGGANLEFQFGDIDGWIAHVRCTDCDDMIGPMSEWKYPNQEEAAKDASDRWNRRAPPASAKNETAIEPVDFLSGMRVFLETFVVDGDVPFLDAPVQWNANDFANDCDQARQSLTEAATHLAEITRQRDEALAKVTELEGKRNG